MLRINVKTLTVKQSTIISKIIPTRRLEYNNVYSYDHEGPD